MRGDRQRRDRLRSMARQPRDRGGEGDDGRVVRSCRFCALHREPLRGAQTGGFLYGLPTTNPVSTEVLYRGDVDNFGTDADPMLGSILGGTVVFGGGLPLYSEDQALVGALGVSGDTSCADHNVAWRVREALGLAAVPSSVSPSNDDAIIYDVRPSGGSASGYGHVMCGNSITPKRMNAGRSKKRPIASCTCSCRVCSRST